MRLLITEALPMDVTTHYVHVNSFFHTEMREWINEQTGTGRVWVGGHGLFFERKEDATIFALRWV